MSRIRKSKLLNSSDLLEFLPDLLGPGSDDATMRIERIQIGQFLLGVEQDPIHLTCFLALFQREVRHIQK